jgi:predicted permease
METLIADLRLAFRGMRKNLGFTITAVAALALGIGANTAIFSVVNAVILKPLAFPEPDRLVGLERSYKEGNSDSVSIPKFMYWKDHGEVWDSITAYDFGGPGLNLSTGNQAEQVTGLHISQQFFRVFGGRTLLGRVFDPSEDLPNGPRVAVLSYALWSHRFASDPQMIGKKIDLSGLPYTVVGVTTRGFEGPREADLWLPLQADPASDNMAHYLTVVARLKPGVGVPAANARLKLVARGFRRMYPKALDPSEGIIAIPMQEQMVGNVRPALTVLVCAVCFVLLIACANMANLMLARASAKQRDLAVRVAIGASRGRLVRQMLTESLLLSLSGAAFGLLLGAWGVRGLLRISPGEIPRVDQLVKASPLAFLDWRVFLFTLGVALVTGILFGLFPALRLSNPDLNATLKEASSRSGTGMHQNRARSMLVVSEITLAIVLLTGAGLLIRSFESLRSVSTGLDTNNVLTFQTSLAEDRFNHTAEVSRVEREAVEKMERVPGIKAAAAVWMLPLQSNLDLPFNIAGKAAPKAGQYLGDELWRPITPHYFDVYRIPLKRGRVFSQDDTAGSQPVVVINEALAAKYWPHEDPIGKQMLIGQGLGPQFDDRPRQVVGVVGSQREQGLTGPMAPVMFLPSTQISDGLTQFANPLLPRFWVVRTASKPTDYTNAIRAVFRSVDSKMAPAKVSTMDEILAGYTARQNFNMLLLSVFAGIALLLAAVGIFGLISYSVQQRTQEIGIRIALGAGRVETLRLVGTQMIILLGAGLALGMSASWAVMRYMASLLFAVKPEDPLTFGAVILALTLVTLVATVIPARRAMKVDPMIALRYE